MQWIKISSSQTDDQQKLKKLKKIFFQVTRPLNFFYYTEWRCRPVLTERSTECHRPAGGIAAALMTSIFSSVMVTSSVPAGSSFEARRPSCSHTRSPHLCLEEDPARVTGNVFPVYSYLQRATGQAACTHCSNISYRIIQLCLMFNKLQKENCSHTHYWGSLHLSAHFAVQYAFWKQN